MRTFSYDDALSYIHGTLRFGSRPGLSRISALAGRLGNPQDYLKFIHVAGTNGKGSTTAMTASVLKEAGYKTGMFISPYLEDFRERIQIDGEYIPKHELARLAEVIKNEIDAMLKEGLEHPTEFEIITAMAFCWFYERKCDYVVLEVGLGGAIDSTNIIKCPLVSVITSVSIDHTEYLGETLEEITLVKCGIIKEGGTVVTSPGQPHAALEIIKRETSLKGGLLMIPDINKLSVESSDLSGSVISYCGLRLKIPLIGAHQIKNALTCMECVYALRKSGASIDNDSIVSGFLNVKWPGRLEIIRENPLCLIDAAHNIEGVSVLSGAIDSIFEGIPIITVMGMLKDKDYKNCIPIIASRSSVFISATPLGERALDSCTAAEIAGRHCANVIDGGDIENAVKTALKAALKAAKNGGVIIACGSLMLIGEAGKLLKTSDTR